MNEKLKAGSMLRLRDLIEDVEVEIRILVSAELDGHTYVMALMAEEEEAFILKVAESTETGAAYVLLSAHGENIVYAAEPEDDREWNRVAEHLEKESEYIIHQAEEEDGRDTV